MRYFIVLRQCISPFCQVEGDGPGLSAAVAHSDDGFVDFGERGDPQYDPGQGLHHVDVAPVIVHSQVV